MAEKAHEAQVQADTEKRRLEKEEDRKEHIGKLKEIIEGAREDGRGGRE